MKTVRFKQLVEASGKPEVKALWGPAEEDRELQRAIKESRVLTLHQENVGSKKDYGVIGFWPEHTAQYVIFPKSLKQFSDRRVIGIDYGMMEPEPARAGKKASAPESPPRAEKARRPAQRSTARPAKESPSPTPRPSPPPKKVREARHPEAAPDRATVLKEIHATLDELEAGKAVPALRRLERLAARLELP